MQSEFELGRGLFVSLLVITGLVWCSDVFREQVIKFVDRPTWEYRQEQTRENGKPPKLLISYFGWLEYEATKNVLDVETFDLPPNSEFAEKTWCGFFLRFLMTEVSPSDYGNLDDFNTWKCWWGCCCSIAGISKALLLSAFYFLGFAVLFGWLREASDFFAALSFLKMLVAVPYIAWILLVPAFIGPGLSAVFSFLSSIFAEPLASLLAPTSFYEWLIFHVGVTIVGTAIIVVLSPILLLHGWFV